VLARDPRHTILWIAIELGSGDLMMLCVVF
jgi:hypothetical protein